MRRTKTTLSQLVRLVHPLHKPPPDELSVSASTKAPTPLRIFLDIYPVCSIMGDCPRHWICKAIHYCLISSICFVIWFSYSFYHSEYQARVFPTRSTIGHFGLWHFGSGVEYKADVAPGQHINDFYEYFRVYNR
jgi:hypothetical protein